MRFTCINYLLKEDNVFRANPLTEANSKEVYLNKNKIIKKVEVSKEISKEIISK